MAETPNPSQQHDSDADGWHKVAEEMHDWHPALQEHAARNLAERGIEISPEHHQTHIDIARPVVPNIDDLPPEEQDLAGEIIEIGQEALIGSDEVDPHETTERETAILPEAPAEVAQLLALNHEIKDFDDLDDVAGALIGVPMLNRHDIDQNIVRHSEGSTVHKDVTIPMSRIVGIRTFDTWAGRGFNEDGTLKIKNGGSSLAEVAKCAKLGQMDEYVEHSGSPRLTLFEDADGEVWAYVRQDGSHRVAGAKARGDQYLHHATVDDAEVRDKVGFSVREALTEQHEDTEGWDEYASELTRMSKLVDGESDPVDEKFQQKFEASKARLENTLQKKRERLARLQETAIPQRIKAYEERHGEPPTAEWIAAFTAGGEQGIRMNEQQLEFLRPTSEADIAYRNKVVEELPGKILENTPPDLPLKFHGTSIYTARDIIASRELSSSVDRLGIEASYDTADQVSITTPDSVKITLDSYSGLTEENYNVPAGCVFVLLPSSKEDADTGASLLMGNVNFGEHPDQLFAVMTSGENVELVKQWAEEAGVDPAKVKEFFEFTDDLGQLKESIENGTARAKDYVSYPL